MSERIDGAESGHKTGIKLYIYHPTNLHGGEFRFVNLFFHKWKEIMSKTDLTNQRQVFVEEYVRSGEHLETAKKASELIPCLISTYT